VLGVELGEHLPGLRVGRVSRHDVGLRIHLGGRVIALEQFVEPRPGCVVRLTRSLELIVEFSVLRLGDEILVNLYVLGILGDKTRDLGLEALADLRISGAQQTSHPQLIFGLPLVDPSHSRDFGQSLVCNLRRKGLEHDQANNRESPNGNECQTQDGNDKRDALSDGELLHGIFGLKTDHRTPCRALRSVPWVWAVGIGVGITL